MLTEHYLRSCFDFFLQDVTVVFMLLIGRCVIFRKRFCVLITKYKNPLEANEVTDLFLFKNEVRDWYWDPAASRVSPQPPQWGWRKFSVDWLHANSIWIRVSLLKIRGTWTLPICEHQLSFYLGRKTPSTTSAAESGIKRNGNGNVFLNMNPSFNSSRSFSSA